MWRGSGRSGTLTRSRSCPGPSEWTLDTCHVLAGLTRVSRYRRNVYGELQDNTRALDTASVRDLVAREERRWQQADMDGDLALNIAEFQARPAEATLVSSH